MGYVGNTPAWAPIDASQVPDGILPLSKMRSDAISALTALTASGLDTSADYVWIWDASVPGFRKINPAAMASQVLLSSQTASSSATLDFTGLTGYASYEFHLSNVVPASNNVSLGLRTSTDNGSTFSAGGSDYLYTKWEDDSAASSGASGSGAASSIVLTANVSSSSSWGVSGRVFSQDLSVSASRKVFHSTVTRLSNGDAVIVKSLVSGAYNNSGVINAVRFIYSSGNIASGTIRCYGIR